MAECVAIIIVAACITGMIGAYQLGYLRRSWQLVRTLQRNEAIRAGVACEHAPPLRELPHVYSCSACFDAGGCELCKPETLMFHNVDEYLAWRENQ